MADFKRYFKQLMLHEGGFVDDPDDKGGATKFGVTLGTWIQQGRDKDCDGDIDVDDLKLIDLDDAYVIAKINYWDKLKADGIYNQSIAEFIFDWGYNSGYKTAAKKVQETVGVTVDGIIGSQTLKAINDADQEDLFYQLKAKREAFFRSIVANNPSQKKFLKGWLNRNNSFIFHA